MLSNTTYESFFLQKFHQAIMTTSYNDFSKRRGSAGHIYTQLGRRLQGMRKVVPEFPPSVTYVSLRPVFLQPIYHLDKNCVCEKVPIAKLLFSWGFTYRFLGIA